MKISHYDVLQVSPQASGEVIGAAYRQLQARFAVLVEGGDDEARNQLIFVEEAYAVLGDPARRAAYDDGLRQAATLAAVPLHSGNDFAEAWDGGLTRRVLLGIALACAAFGAYKFLGQRNEQQVRVQRVDIEGQRAFAERQTQATHVENERMLVQGAVNNQEKLIDRSYEVTRREQDYRAQADAQRIEMQRQVVDAHLQEQRWRQEQYEKERQQREARLAAEAPQRQLCRMYELREKFAEAQAAGCWRYR